MELHTQNAGLGAKRREGGLWMLIAGSLLAAGGYALEPTKFAQDDGDGFNLEVNLPSAVLGNSDSNHRMIAVTGIDVTGNNVLYVIDTISAHLAVYQANGGSKGTQGIKLVAARNIGLDLRLNGFNDDSDHTYEDLEERFIEDGLLEDE
ncbi:MAG: hypothetical protein ACI8X5_000556 [Planctomycetota bacterium]|jgi:hypothetical protein